MKGGDGADIFLYASAAEGGDVIKGYVVGADGIEVSAAGFGGGLSAGTLGASRFVLGTAADQAFGQFVYDAGADELWFDADGTGAGASVLIADFGGKPALTEADITVIA
jgi:Ca2+-binding RTX toxin-like protein